MYNNYIWK